MQESILQRGIRRLLPVMLLWAVDGTVSIPPATVVHGFTLTIPPSAAFVLTNENMKMPEQGSYYSVNEANRLLMAGQVSRVCGQLRSARWGGSTVRVTSAVC